MILQQWATSSATATNKPVIDRSILAEDALLIIEQGCVCNIRYHKAALDDHIRKKIKRVSVSVDQGVANSLG